MIEQLKKQIGKDGISFKSVTAIILFGAIVVVFILFGFQGKHNQIGTGAAARVNDTLISVADLRSEVNRMEQMYGQLFAGQFSGEAQRQFLRQQALESLITSELASQVANKSGILVTDVEVRDYLIKEMPVFQKDGKFNREMYTRVLEANNLTPADFENKVRKEKKNLRSRRVLELASTPLLLEIEQAKKLKEQKLNLSFARIDRDGLVSEIQYSTAEINKALQDSEFKKQVEIEFKANRASYNTEEQIKAQHILIKVDPNQAGSEAKALEKIKDLREKAQKGDFAKLAKEHSEDMGSKKNGGDLGYFGKGRMVPEFEKAAFSQAIGVVGEPVKTNYGYHLIKVTDKKAAKEATLETEQVSIAKKLMGAKKVDGMIAQIEAAMKSGDEKALDSAAKALNLKWEETGFFDLSIDAVPKLGGVAAAEAASLSDKNRIAKSVVRDGAFQYVLKFKDKKVEPLKEANQLAESMGKERAYEIYASWIEQEKKGSTIEKNNEAIER